MSEVPVAPGAHTLELLRKEGDLRASEIAKALGHGCTALDVHNFLQPFVDDGRVFAVSIETEQGKFRGYRLAAAGGGDRQPGATQAKPLRERVPPLKIETTFGTDRAHGPAMTPPVRIPAKEKSQMTNADKIVAALKRHGPMTTREAGKHLDVPYLSIAMAQLAGKKGIVRLGGGAHSTIYGLPGQKLPAAGDGVDMDAAHATASKKAKKAKKTKKRTGGGKRVQRKSGRGAKTASAVRAALARAEDRLVAKSARASLFRPAIACDGALLLTGARGQGELNSAETRVLAEFLARVDRSGARA